MLVKLKNGHRLFKLGRLVIGTAKERIAFADAHYTLGYRRGVKAKLRKMEVK